MPDRAREELDAVVTHHRDGFRSGVARFNELLAERLGVRVVGIDELSEIAPSCPLLSFKMSELDPVSAATLDDWLAGGRRHYEIFLHEFRGSEPERELVLGAQRVHCGNAEIEAAVDGLARAVDTLWTPGLILDDRGFRRSDISVFSFGMAHKVQTEKFRRLRSLLEATERSYAVYVSAANHETASLRDSHVVFEEMHDIFPDELYFLGNLSDVAVHNYLSSMTFFAAFFERGVRSNNTSVASALERGAVVITNLDEYSPPAYRHMETVIDITQADELPLEPLAREEIGRRAAELGGTLTWQRLVERLR